MEREEILNKLTGIFRSIFNDQNLEIGDDLTANDVENWDSLTHMLLISEVESNFSVKFKLKELNKMHNVGDMVNFIQEKI